MRQRWLTPHTLYVSDPSGERFLQPIGLFEPDERGGIGRPGVVLLRPDGSVAYRYVGRDFADRTTDAELLAALDELDLDPIEPPDGGPELDVPDTLRGYFRPEMYGAYFAGNRSAAKAFSSRSTDPVAHELAAEHIVMCKRSIDAWNVLNGR